MADSILRESQKEKLEEIRTHLKSEGEANLTSPTDWGKTLVFLHLAVEDTPVVILAPTYEAVRNILKEMKKFDYLRNKIKNKIIILPEGKGRCKRKCDYDKVEGRGRLPKVDKKKIFGKEIGTHNIQDLYPNKDPYRMLKHLISHGDIIITVWDYFAQNYLEFPTNFIILDESDQYLEPISFTLVDYPVTETQHLETPRQNNLRTIINILNKVDCPYNRPEEEALFRNRIEGLKSITETLEKQFAPSPIQAETESVGERIQNGSKKEITYGLMATTGKIKNEVEDWSKHFFEKKPDGLADEFEYRKEDFCELTYAEQELIQRYCEVIREVNDFTYAEARKEEEEERGYLQIFAVREKSEVEEYLSQFDKALYVSATQDPKQETEIPQVEVKEDVQGDKKLVLFCSNPRKLVKEIRDDYNILGITTSRDRAIKGKREYGGNMLAEDNSLKEDLERLERTKGQILWDYIESTTSRATNNLHPFDGCVVRDWINRADLQYPEEEQMKKKCLNHTHQHMSRIFRTVDGEMRKRFAIVDDKELFEGHKELRPNWRYEETQSVEEAKEIIKEHTEPLSAKGKPPKVRLKVDDNGNVYGRIPGEFELDELEEEKVVEWDWK